MNTPLGIGVAGLGRAFSIMLPTFARDPRVRLVAASDPRGEACARFARDCGGRIHDDIAALVADPEVDVLYVSSPHRHHAPHAIAAARAGKHVLVEKPMALSLAEAQAMIDAVERAGTTLIVGHSHSFDAPIQRTKSLIGTPAIGALRMITALNFTDFLYRPRRPEELATSAGGGVIFNQAAHQVDIVRLLGGGRVAAVRAQAGIWDPARPTEGAYAAFFTFDNGVCATLTYNGYAHFDSDEFTDWIGEMGQQKDPQLYGAARRALAAVADADDELALKHARNYGGAGYGGAGYGGARADTERLLHQQFGLVIASCDHADLRPLPRGVMIYGDTEARLDALAAPTVPRREVIDELCAAVWDGVSPVHDGRWGMATLEACTAILRSSREGREIALAHQVATDPAARSQAT